MGVGQKKVPKKPRFGKRKNRPRNLWSPVGFSFDPRHLDPRSAAQDLLTWTSFKHKEVGFPKLGGIWRRKNKKSTKKATKIMGLVKGIISGRKAFGLLNLLFLQPNTCQLFFSPVPTGDRKAKKAQGFMKSNLKRVEYV